MTDFFYAIQDLFVNYLLLPYDVLAKLELDSWFGANIVSWVFMLIGFVAFLYWMKQLKGYNDSNDDDKSITSHSYL